MTERKQDQAWVESQRAANAKAAKRHRDAITGQYVDEDHVKANPDTTVTETRRAPHHPELLLKRIEALETDVALLIDTIKRMGDVDRLIGAINTQQSSNQQLAESVGALAQCVAMVMEEELGTPVPDKPEPVETDWDGNPVA